MNSRVLAASRFLIPTGVACAALVLGIVNHCSIHTPAADAADNAAVPKVLNNIDWLQTLPDRPGADRIIEVSEDLELLGYRGFRYFMRTPALELKPGEALYYGDGLNIYEGTLSNERRTDKRGLGIEAVPVSGGGGWRSADVPDGFEYSVFYRVDNDQGTVSGFERFGEVDPRHHVRVSGSGRPFTFHFPPGAHEYPTLQFREVKVGKEIEFANLAFAPRRPDGTEDLEHLVTIRWFIALAVGRAR